MYLYKEKKYIFLKCFIYKLEDKMNCLPTYCFQNSVYKEKEKLMMAFKMSYIWFLLFYSIYNTYICIGILKSQREVSFKYFYYALHLKDVVMWKYSQFFQCFQKLLVLLQNCTFLLYILSQGSLEQTLPVYLNYISLVDSEFWWHFHDQEKLKFKRTIL